MHPEATVQKTSILVPVSGVRIGLPAVHLCFLNSNEALASCMQIDVSTVFMVEVG
jgi:hypothetical protein